MVLRALNKNLLFPLTTIVLLSALGLRVTVNANDNDYKRFCPYWAIVDLTNATRIPTGFIDEYGYFFPTEIVSNELDSVWRGCMCDVELCVLICPEITDLESNWRIPSAEFPLIYTTNLTLKDAGNPQSEPEEWFNTFFWNPCVVDQMYFLEPDEYPEDKWYLLENGSLYLPRQNGTEIFLSWRQYCFLQEENRTTYTPQVCSPKAQPDPFITASYIGGLISVPFIIATIFVYSILSELRNIHGTIFKYYLSCLLVTYITLAAHRIPKPDVNIGTICLILGFVIYYSFLTSFLWLNIICIDMWLRFRDYGSYRINRKPHDRKRFIGYSIYAWGTSTVLTAVCISLEFTPGIPESVITPGFTQRSCWFSTKKAAALFFYGPVGLTIFCNICLFVSMSIKLIQHQKNIQSQLSCVDSQRHNNNKLLFSLYLRLFVIMGISWSVEVISGLWEDPKQVWYFTDMVNSLQGLLIFIIFVCKKKILHSLKRRFKSSLLSNERTFTFNQRNLNSRSTTNSFVDSISRFNDSIALNIWPNTSPERHNSIEASNQRQ